ETSKTVSAHRERSSCTFQPLIRRGSRVIILLADQMALPVAYTSSRLHMRNTGHAFLYRPRFKLGSSPSVFTSRSSTLLIVLTCAVLLSCPRSIAQESLAQMYHRSWTVREGAPANIEDMIQGPDGFLWITTDNGLYRFDGVTFERYRPPNGA